MGGVIVLSGGGMVRACAVFLSEVPPTRRSLPRWARSVSAKRSRLELEPIFYGRSGQHPSIHLQQLWSRWPQRAV